MKKVSIFERIKNAITGHQTGEAKKPANSAPARKESYVYVTAKGKKFHYDLLCPGIRNSKEIKIDLSKARKAGYKACDKCCFDYLHD